MVKAYGVIYYIVNTINGKMYVGQTINFNKRIKDKAKLVEIFNKPIDYLMFKEEFL